MSHAQGTIEYLVIIAVVVVMGLIVVSMAVSTLNNPSQQLSSASASIGSTIGPISITESVLDENGDGLIRLGNNSGETISVTKVRIGESDVNYPDSTLVSGSEAVFSLDNIGSACSCSGASEARQTCTVIVYTKSEYGLTDHYSTTTTIDCVQNVQSSNPAQVIQPILSDPPCVPGGTGTLADPLEICDCNSVQNIELRLDGNYFVGQDIDCNSATRLGGILWNGGLGFKPIGNDVNKFTGSLNGGGHKVSGLYINRTTDYVGLIGYAGPSSIITRIGVYDANVTGHSQVGALAGFSSGQISRSYSTGTVYGKSTGTNPNHTGGLVGLFSGTLSDCYVWSAVSAGSGSYYVGGMMGTISSGGTVNRA
ncbi:MAG: hypothetical protein AABW59_03110, partial [archaeon]